MVIAIGNDHGGLEYKRLLLEHLLKEGYDVIDAGTDSSESCHYPVFAREVAGFVARGEANFGILICTTGEGIMMAANKVKGIRAGIGYADDVCALMRKHNNANVISFGQKFMAYEDVERRVDIFLNTEFEGGRHQIRVDMINKIESE